MGGEPGFGEEGPTLRVDKTVIHFVLCFIAYSLKVTSGVFSDSGIIL